MATSLLSTYRLGRDLLFLYAHSHVRLHRHEDGWTLEVARNGEKIAVHGQFLSSLLIAVSKLADIVRKEVK